MSQARILLVDDDPAILETYAILLRTHGYEVWEAATGQQCLQLTRERRPDLVLLDVRLPDLSGIEVCRQIKADASLPDTFVVLISGTALSSADKVDGLELGADDYLVKGSSFEELLARIRTIVRLHDTTAALRASEQRYRELVEIMPDAVGLIDHHGRLLTVNPQAVAMLGYDSTAELLDKTVFDLTGPEDHARIRSDMATVLRTGSLRNVEYTMVRKDGHRFPAELSGAVAGDASDQAVGLVVVVRDITQRKQAEAERRSLEEHRRLGLEAARMVTWDYDIARGSIRYSENMPEFVGGSAIAPYCDLESVLLQMHPDDRDRVRAGLKRAEAPGAVFEEEYRAKMVDETYHWIGAKGRVVRDEAGVANRIYGLSMDITAKKQAEEQIRLLADAVQSTQELICITDSQNRFTFANQAFLQAYGYGLEEILGRDPQILYPPSSPPGLRERVFQQTLAGGWIGELLNRRKDGTEFPISLTTSQIKDSRGQILGLIGVARDVTDRKQAERQRAVFSQLGYRLSAAIAPRQAAQMILDMASELFSWDAGYVHLYSQSDDRLIPVLTMDTIDGQRKPLDPASITPDLTPLMRLTMKEGAQLVDGGADTPLRACLVPFGDRDRHSACMMYAPIRSGGAAIGILSIQSYVPCTYSQDDLRLLQALGDHCGDALQGIKGREALREAEAKYRSIFENATEGIFQTTPDGTYRSANPALARMLGYQTPQELIAAVTDIEHQAYVKPERRADLRRLMEAQGFVNGFEVQQYRKDGSIIWVSLNGHVVRDPNGAVLYYEGTSQDITERKQAQARLADALELNLTILATSSVGIMAYRAAGQCIFANGAAGAIVGSSPEQLLRQNFRHLASWRQSGLLAMAERTLNTRAPQAAEIHGVSSSGKEVWMDCHMASFVSGDEQHLLMVSNEITERKRAERQLQLQHDLSVLLASTNDLNTALERLLSIAILNDGIDCGAVYVVNPKTRRWDLAACQGLSAGFAEQASHFAAPAARLRSSGNGQGGAARQVAPGAGLRQQLRREGVLATQIIPIRHSRETVAVLGLGSHARRKLPSGSSGTTATVAAQVGDAIARIRAEQSLRAHRQLLEKSLHSLRAAVIIVDADTGAIQECNPGTSRMFGYTRKELIGRTTDFLHLDQRSCRQFRAELDLAVRRQGFLNDFEFRMRRKDGTVFPSEHSVMPIRDESGRLLHWVSLVRDVTQRRQLEQELRHLPQRVIAVQEAERARMARELHDGANQIIASARMRLHKVQSTARSLGPASREILARCNRLLVQALEENRRIAHNLHPNVLDELGLAAACRNLCRELRLRTNLKVRCDIGRFVRRMPPAFELNLFRIAQEVLGNLEKHARAKNVRLRLTRRDASIILQIHDDGRGFDRRRAGAGKGRRHGFGLTNIRERAVSLGGTCEIESAPGRGTTVTVSVPCPGAKKRPGTRRSTLPAQKTHAPSVSTQQTA